MDKQYLTAAQVRARFGGISDMTLWRWIRDERLGFPAPIVIQRRRFFDSVQLDGWARMSQRVSS